MESPHECLSQVLRTILIDSSRSVRPSPGLLPSVTRTSLNGSSCSAYPKSGVLSSAIPHALFIPSLDFFLSVSSCSVYPKSGVLSSAIPHALFIPSLYIDFFLSVLSCSVYPNLTYYPQRFLIQCLSPVWRTILKDSSCSVYPSSSLLLSMIPHAVFIPALAYFPQ